MTQLLTDPTRLIVTGDEWKAIQRTGWIVVEGEWHHAGCERDDRNHQCPPDALVRLTERCETCDGSGIDPNHWDYINESDGSLAAEWNDDDWRDFAPCPDCPRLPVVKPSHVNNRIGPTFGKWEYVPLGTVRLTGPVVFVTDDPDYTDECILVDVENDEVTWFAAEVLGTPLGEFVKGAVTLPCDPADAIGKFAAPVEVTS